ncbi:pectate lyase [Massilia sp. Root418]|jgi:PelA/Pel-15E family pectate lyase|uniref:pectate lyase n=1 Tax=Massilia sp. Root418 TaxID=1736532 RepID=UPI000A6C7926|nr:pectate lyase [Massilia sp. Root418]
MIKKTLAAATAAALLAMGVVPLAAHAGIIGYMQTPEALSEARIAAAAPAEQGAWLAYLARSRALMAADKAALAAEREAAPGKAAVPAPPHNTSHDGGMPLNRPAAWYGSADARRVAANILSYQTPAGGWGKNADRASPPRQPGQHYVVDDMVPGSPPRKDAWNFVGTIDNDATTTELRFLARVQAQAPGADGDAYRASFAKGLRYLLNAQYPNGGYPQIYPLQGGYHDAITFNDNALSSVVSLLNEISAGKGAAGKGDYAFVPPAVAGEARAAAARAVRLIVATQIVVDGKRTAWCQQHDPITLAPVGARNFEPPALASGESASLAMLLMSLPDPEPDSVAAVRAAAAWLQRAALRDVEWTGKDPVNGRRLVARPGAGPLWSRYYDIATMKPIFGDRDRSIHDDVNAISLERRNGYAWFSNGPAKALEAYQRWPGARLN